MSDGLTVAKLRAAIDALDAQPLPAFAPRLLVSIDNAVRIFGRSEADKIWSDVGARPDQVIWFHGDGRPEIAQ